MFIKENLLETSQLPTQWHAMPTYILLIMCTLLSYSELIGQASCVAPNTVNIFPSAPSIGNNGGTFTINASQIDDGSTGTLVGISFNANTFTSTTVIGNCVNFQPSNEVEVWLFVDNGGTQTSCSTMVDLVDNHAPVIECLGNNVYLDATTGEVTLTTAMIATAFENCNLASFDFDGGAPTFDCDDLGVGSITLKPQGTNSFKSSAMHTVTLIATDDTGNSSSTSCNFTLVDTVPPVARCIASLAFNLSDQNGII